MILWPIERVSLAICALYPPKFVRLEGLAISPWSMHIVGMTGEIQPRRLKRPRDANQLAKLIIDIATGQVEDREPTPGQRGKRPEKAPRDLSAGKEKSTKK